MDTYGEVCQHIKSVYKTKIMECKSTMDEDDIENVAINFKLLDQMYSNFSN